LDVGCLEHHLDAASLVLFDSSIIAGLSEASLI
jgi:hypothetical protein